MANDRLPIPDPAWPSETGLLDWYLADGPDFFVLVDAASKVRLALGGVRPLLGQDAASAVGIDFCSACPLPALAEEVAKVQADGIPREFEVNLVGRRFQVVLDPYPSSNRTGAVAVLARQKVPPAAEASDSIERLYDHLDDIVYSLSLDGVLLSINNAVERILGYRRDEVLGGPVNVIFGADALAEMAKMRDQKLVGRKYTRYEIHARGKNGRLVLLQINSRLVVHDGRPTAIWGVARDISDQTGAELARRQMQDQLLQLQRRDSLGVMVGSLAQDFNNLLQAILGQCGAALLKAGANAPSAEHLLRIEDTAVHAAALCNQLLAHGGRGQIVVETIDLSITIREMLPLLSVAVKDRASLELDLSDRLPAIDGDATQIRQAVFNLVTNAADAHVAADVKNAAVIVRTGVAVVGADYLSACVNGDQAPAGAYVWFEVTDQGEGIAAELLDRILDPFFSTRTGAHGLGLSAVRDIAEKHKGYLRFERPPGGGATIRVLLPPAVSDGDTVDFDHILHPAEPTSRGTILVADDQPIVLGGVQAILEMHGFDVLIATNGGEAVDQFRRRQHDIDFVILDVTMPVMDGIAALDAIHALDAAVPVFLASGFSEQDALRGTVDRDVRGFFQKPFRFEELIQKLDECPRRQR